MGAYFGQNMQTLVTRLLGEQLEDGGWNCEAENGSVRPSFTTRPTFSKACGRMNSRREGRRKSPRPGNAEKNILWNGNSSGRRAREKSSRKPGCGRPFNSHVEGMRSQSPSPRIFRYPFALEQLAKGYVLRGQLLAEIVFEERGCCVEG